MARSTTKRVKNQKSTSSNNPTAAAATAPPPLTLLQALSPLTRLSACPLASGTRRAGVGRPAVGLPSVAGCTPNARQAQGPPPPVASGPGTGCPSARNPTGLQVARPGCRRPSTPAHRHVPLDPTATHRARRPPARETSPPKGAKASGGGGSRARSSHPQIPSDRSSARGRQARLPVPDRRFFQKIIASPLPKVSRHGSSPAASVFRKRFHPRAAVGTHQTLPGVGTSSNNNQSNLSLYISVAPSPLAGPRPERLKQPETAQRESAFSQQIEPTRAYTQWLVATRLLDHLHDPVGQLSRLQRIHPCAL